ncbi:hypothetical protein TSAR_012120 [Trichomalopsis sarcophagae]|uniref:Peptidase S1 domain-containing protein n=1 Tax=Trichomalopsis sarcophagae TaxID=543379 RepID=A0A232EQC0_9HYME|nr:hypothetical protein TSAR_012120 [Trichomalopsis sarcophagae]
MFDKRFIFICSSLFFLANRVFATLEPEVLSGGELVTTNPYLVSIKLGTSPVCSGAIIDDQFILTAAHCFINRNGRFINSPFKIVAACVDLNDTKDAIEIDVEKIYALKAFATNSYVNDIAVLKLKSGLSLGSDSPLRKVNLPTSDESYVDQTAVIGGFGWNDIKVVVHPLTNRKYSFGGGPSDNKLRFAKARLLPKSECEQITRPYKLIDSQFCAKIIERNATLPGRTCLGDSGGPLMMLNTVIGILSTGPGGCDEHNEASKYTKVFSFSKFIQNAKNDIINDEIRVQTCPNR